MIRLAKFNGLLRHSSTCFHLDLKKTEWRYNNRNETCKTLLRHLRQNPLN